MVGGGPSALPPLVRLWRYSGPIDAHQGNIGEFRRQSGEYERQNEEHMNKDTRELLERTIEVLDNYVDVNDGDDGQPRPNAAMSLQEDIRQHLEREDKNDVWTAGFWHVPQDRAATMSEAEATCVVLGWSLKQQDDEGLFGVYVSPNNPHRAALDREEDIEVTVGNIRVSVEWP